MFTSFEHGYKSIFKQKKNSFSFHCVSTKVLVVIVLSFMIIWVHETITLFNLHSFWCEPIKVINKTYRTFWHFLIIIMSLNETINKNSKIIKFDLGINQLWCLYSGIKITAGQQTWPAKFYVLSIQNSVITEMTSHFFLEQLTILWDWCLKG